MAGETTTSASAGDSAASAAATAAPSKRVRRGLFDDINTLLTCPYYALNVMLTASYIVTREKYRYTPIRQEMLFMGEITDYQSWERYVAFLCGSYAAFRVIKARSRFAGLTALLDFAQLFVAIMAMVCSPLLLAHLACGYALVYLLFPQPLYPPLYDELEQLTPEHLGEDVRQPGTDVTWVVFYYAHWHPGCRAMAPNVADLAARYGNEKLRFAMLDVGEYTKTATKLGIELSPVSQQLPTIALYEKGEEAARLPQKKANGGLYGSGFKAKDVVKVLELDMRFARSLQKATERKGQ